MKQSIAILICVSGILTTGCSSSGGSSFSLLSTGQSFQQSSQTINTKLDVLWVIDSSGSMASSQQNLADNFPSFINMFTGKGYDFQIAVTTSDAYLALPAWTNYYNQNPRPSYYNGQAQDLKARFMDGIGATHTGVFVINPLTPNLNSVFTTNVKVGIAGHGDERSLQSFRAALDNQHNAGFVRPDGFLAVILVTDEDDFSHDGTGYKENMYNDPALHTIQHYVNYLDGVTSSSGATRRYSVNTISINDQTCLNQLQNGAQKIGVRVGQMADATGGIKTSLCGDFANELENLAQSIVELSTQFYLQIRPQESTIQIHIDGQVVPHAPTNPNGNGGWTYNSAANSIMFSGDYIPPQSAQIDVQFDPDGINF